METEHRSFGEPDETRPFPNGRAEIVRIGGGEIGRLVFEPGWDVTSLPSGHDAWVVGDEPMVTLDWFGAGRYAT